jgi:hypothetical protein
MCTPATHDLAPGTQLPASTDTDSPASATHPDNDRETETMNTATLEQTQTDAASDCAVIESGLSLNPAWPLQTSEQALTLQEFASVLKVRLVLDAPLLARLFQLLDQLALVQADEIGDWALDARCAITSTQVGAPPVLLGIGATVYASGDVFVCVTLEGLDAALWLVEPLDLSNFNRTEFGHG